MGRPRQYPDRATRQWAYRKRLEEQRDREEEIEFEVRMLLETALDRGIIFDCLSKREQLRELRLWLERRAGRRQSLDNVTL